MGWAASSSCRRPLHEKDGQARLILAAQACEQRQADDRHIIFRRQGEMRDPVVDRPEARLDEMRLNSFRQKRQRRRGGCGATENPRAPRRGSPG
jgi:hypothetical protein